MGQERKTEGYRVQPSGVSLSYPSNAASAPLFIGDSLSLKQSRELHAGDLSACLALLNDSRSLTTSQKYTSPDEIKKLLSRKAKRDLSLIVCEYHTSVSGYSAATNHPTHQLITNLTVGTAFRKRQVGSALLLYHLFTAALRGQSSVLIGISESNTGAADFLRDRGFTLTAKQRSVLPQFATQHLYAFSLVESGGSPLPSLMWTKHNDISVALRDEGRFTKQHAANVALMTYDHERDRIVGNRSNVLSHLEEMGMRTTTTYGVESGNG